MLPVPPEYRKQHLEGEQASFDEQPHSCGNAVGSEEEYWWNRGYEAAEDLHDESPQ